MADVLEGFHTSNSRTVQCQCRPTDHDHQFKGSLVQGRLLSFMHALPSWKCWQKLPNWLVNIGGGRTKEELRRGADPSEEIASPEMGARYQDWQGRVSGFFVCDRRLSICRPQNDESCSDAVELLRYTCSGKRQSRQSPVFRT